VKLHKKHKKKTGAPSSIPESKKGEAEIFIVNKVQEWEKKERTLKKAWVGRKGKKIWQGRIKELVE